MDNTTLTALDTFTTTLTSSINATDVLTVIGKGVAAAAVLYIVQWGARKIVKIFRKAMNGRIGV